MDKKTVKLGLLLFIVNLFIAVSGILAAIVFDPSKGIILATTLVIISPFFIKKFLKKMT